jgi:hypothetical protein
MDAGIYRKPSDTGRNRQSISNEHYHCLNGLIHGLGFASVLENIGLAAKAQISAFMLINPGEGAHSGALVCREGLLVFMVRIHKALLQLLC